MNSPEFTDGIIDSKCFRNASFFIIRISVVLFQSPIPSTPVTKQLSLQAGSLKKNLPEISDYNVQKSENNVTDVGKYVVDSTHTEPWCGTPCVVVAYVFISS